MLSFFLGKLSLKKEYILYVGNEGHLLSRLRQMYGRFKAGVCLQQEMRHNPRAAYSKISHNAKVSLWEAKRPNFLENKERESAMTTSIHCEK